MKKTLLGIVLFLLPGVALAQSNIRDVLLNISGLINIIIPLLIALAIVAFFWGLVQYIWSGGEGHEKGRNVMIAGIMSLFVMLSIFGIVHLISNTFGVGGTNTFTAPTVQVQ